MKPADWKPLTTFAFALVLAMTFFSVAHAEDTATRQYQYEVRVYEVLTSITDSGLISQTLPGINGWLQVIHQKLDDTELVMDGATLTWNGQPSPDNPRIIAISCPTIQSGEREEANIAIGSGTGPLQYMERKQDGLFELKQTDSTDQGLFLGIKPAKPLDGQKLMIDLSFEYSWVKERNKLEGVNLEVGQPVLGNAALRGSVQTRLGEWSCLQTPVESEGWIFVFIRATQVPEAASSTAVSEQKVGPASPESAEKKEAGPKVQVGGSIEVRSQYWHK